MDKIFMNLITKLTPGSSLTCPGAVYMYMTIVVKQVYWYISQISGERLQDHWSSSSYFCSKHRLWVHFRTASVRRFLGVPTIYVFEQKIRKIGIPLHTSVMLYKIVVQRGYTCHGHVFLMFCPIFFRPN